MYFNSRFAELIKTSGVAGENTSGTAGGWVAARDADRLVFIVASNTASLAITLQQATDNTGTGAKALTIDVAIDDAGNVEEAQASVDTIDGIKVVEVLAESLDIDNDFDFVQASIAAGAANVAIVNCQAGYRVRPAHAN